MQRLRSAVRAIVQRTNGGVLLVRFELPTGVLWAAPGGGIEDGESAEAAIRRELREEIGLSEVTLGPVVWTRTHVFPMGDWDGQREQFFFVRVDDAVIAPHLTIDELAAENVTGAAWWSLEELDAAASTTRFAPRRLVEHLRVLLRDGAPAAPIDVGV